MGRSTAWWGGMSTSSNNTSATTETTCLNYFKITWRGGRTVTARMICSISGVNTIWGLQAELGGGYKAYTNFWFPNIVSHKLNSSTVIFTANVSSRLTNHVNWNKSSCHALDYKNILAHFERARICWIFTEALDLLLTVQSCNSMIMCPIVIRLYFNSDWWQP